MYKIEREVDKMNKVAEVNLEIGGKFARMEEVKVFFTLCRLADKKDHSLPAVEELMPSCGYSNLKNFEKIIRHLQRRTLLITDGDSLRINHEWISLY